MLRHVSPCMRHVVLATWNCAMNGAMRGSPELSSHMSSFESRGNKHNEFQKCFHACFLLSVSEMALLYWLIEFFKCCRHQLQTHYCSLWRDKGKAFVSYTHHYGHGLLDGDQPDVEIEALTNVQWRRDKITSQAWSQTRQGCRFKGLLGRTPNVEWK